MNSTEINTNNRSTTVNTPNSSAVFSTSNRSTTVTESQTAGATALAVVGFVALVAAGIWLAVYSTRFVPTVVNGAGAAAVYLGSIFNRSTATLSVVPTPIASSTISSTVASSTTATTTVVQPVPVKTVETTSTTPGEKTTATYPMGGTSAPVTNGLPDFIVVIKDVGYLATSSADSFVASSTVPAGSRPAVSFTIKNVGGSATGSWRFSASIPTQTAYIFQSPPQQSLNPGDSIDYTLGFDQANRGAGQTISITANYDHAVAESNAGNNNASTKVTILGN